MHKKVLHKGDTYLYIIFNKTFFPSSKCKEKKNLKT